MLHDVYPFLGLSGCLWLCSYPSCPSLSFIWLVFSLANHFFFIKCLWTTAKWQNERQERVVSNDGLSFSTCRGFTLFQSRVLHSSKILLSVCIVMWFLRWQPQNLLYLYCLLQFILVKICNECVSKNNECVMKK